MNILQSEFEEEEMSHGQIPIKEKSVRDPKDFHSRELLIIYIQLGVYGWMA